MNETEYWVQNNFPNLLTGKEVERIAPYVENNDLRGLIDYLQLGQQTDRHAVAEWQRAELASRLQQEGQTLKEVLQQQQPTHHIQRKPQLKQQL